MPTVLRVGGFRFFFFSNEGSEPPHIHVKAGSDEAKFWIDPVRLESSGGFNRREIAQIQDLVEENADDLLGSWNEFFGY